MTRKQQLWCCLALIVLSVLAVRLLFFLVYTPGEFHGRRSPDYWLDIARNVVSGEGYTWPEDGAPTARRGPTVVYYFATALWAFGDDLWSVVTVQWLAEVGTAILLFFIVLELFNDRWVALVAALLFAGYAPGLIFTIRAWSEPVFSLTLAGFTLSFLRALRMPTPWRFMMCGAFLGVVILARPIMQFYPFAMLPLLAWRFKWQWRRLLLNGAAVAIGAAIVLTPWVVRNYALFNAFIPGSSHSGVPFYQSHFALGESDYWRYRGTDEWSPALRNVLEARFGPSPDSLTTTHYLNAKGLTEFELDQIAFEESVKTIRAFPGRYLVVSSTRFFRFWFSKQFFEALMGAKKGVSYGYVVALINGTLLILGMVGFLFYRGAWCRTSIPLLLLVGYHTVLYSATVALPRFSVPIMPYVMIFAAYTIVCHLRIRLGRGRQFWDGWFAGKAAPTMSQLVKSRTSSTGQSRSS